MKSCFCNKMYTAINNYAYLLIIIVFIKHTIDIIVCVIKPVPERQIYIFSVAAIIIYTKMFRH